MSELSELRRNYRKQTYAQLAALVSTFRQGLVDYSFVNELDDVYSSKEVHDAMKSVLAAVTSDNDLAIFLATFVGEWIHRSGHDNKFLRMMTGEVYIIEPEDQPDRSLTAEELANLLPDKS